MQSVNKRQLKKNVNFVLQDKQVLYSFFGLNKELQPAIELIGKRFND